MWPIILYAYHIIRSTLKRAPAQTLSGTAFSSLEKQNFRFIYGLLLALLTAQSSSPLEAQDIPTEETQRVQNAIQGLRRQEEAEKLRQAEDERRRFKPSLHDEDKKEKDLGRNRLYKKERQCVYFREVSIKGDPFLSKSEHDKLVKELVRRCLGPEEIGFLIRKTTNYYIERGYVTTRVYIPPQNLNDGSFELRVVPGHIEAIEFKDKNGYRSQIFTAFPTLTGQRLNLRHIEQGLEQINRLQSSNARMRLLPGKKAGASRILIDNQDTKFWSASLGLSNSGSKATGAAVANYSLALDNLFLLNDSLSLSGSRNIAGTGNPENFNRSFSLQWSLPFGYWTISYFRSQSEYLSLISPSGQQKVRYLGDSFRENFSIERNIYRSRTAKTVFSTSVSRNESNNFLEDGLLIHSSGKNSSNEVNLSHSHYTKLGSLRINGGYRFGIHDPENKGITLTDDQTADDLHWKKVEFGLNYSLPFALAGQNFSLQSSYQQQHSDNILHPNEEFAIGGLYTVRGFKEQSISADIGYYSRNELHWYINSSAGPSQASEFWGSPSLFMAYDFGITTSNTRSPNVGSLSGTAVGASSYGKYGHFSLTISQSIARPAHFEQERVIWFSMGLKF